MARNPVFPLTKVALVVGLMLACAGGSHAATPTSDARDSWTWESSAGVGWPPVDHWLPFALEARCGRRISERVSLGMSVGYLGAGDIGPDGGPCVEGYIPIEGYGVSLVPVVGLVKIHLPMARNFEPYAAWGGGVSWFHARSVRVGCGLHTNAFRPQVSALVGFTGRRRFSPRMELRYDCHRGNENCWTLNDEWIQQLSLSLGAQFRAGIHD